MKDVASVFENMEAEYEAVRRDLKGVLQRRRTE